MSLHPQIQALLTAMERPDRPLLHQLDIADARKVFTALPGFLGDLGHHVDSEDRAIDGPAGPVPIRVYAADTEAEGRNPEGRDPGRPLIVFYHGGGFCIGDLDSHDRECQSMAAQAGAVVVSVDYRMGPEHSYTAGDERPAWIDDAWAALQWAAANATALGADPARIVVCGDSAGGNISAVMAQMARDADLPLALQALIYPATDLRDESYEVYPSYQAHTEAPFLDRHTLEYFRTNSRPDGDPRSPFISPSLNDDLSGLAPALVITAEYDPLCDDGEAYAAKLTATGVDVNHRRFDGMPHAFFCLGPIVDAADEAVTLVAKAVAAT